MWESGAILIYLAEKTGQFLSPGGSEKYETLQWVMWQMGGLGPMTGQLGFFHKFAGKDYEDRRPFERYRDEVKRLLGVLEGRLVDREYIMGAEYTIADMASWPWARTITGFYNAADEVGMNNFPNVLRWLDVCASRPASQTAVNIPPRD